MRSLLWISVSFGIGMTGSAGISMRSLRAEPVDAQLWCTSVVLVSLSRLILDSAVPVCHQVSQGICSQASKPQIIPKKSSECAAHCSTWWTVHETARGKATCPSSSSAQHCSSQGYRLLVYPSSEVDTKERHLLVQCQDCSDSSKMRAHLGLRPLPALQEC